MEEKIKFYFVGLSAPPSYFAGRDLWLAVVSSVSAPLNNFHRVSAVYDVAVWATFTAHHQKVFVLCANLSYYLCMRSFVFSPLFTPLTLIFSIYTLRPQSLRSERCRTLRLCYNSVVNVASTLFINAFMSMCVLRTEFLGFFFNALWLVQTCPHEYLQLSGCLCPHLSLFKPVLDFFLFLFFFRIGHLHIF